SSPSSNSSITTPISEAILVKLPLPWRGRRPPCPNASPPRRYSGIGDMPNRPANLPRTPSAKNTAPSSTRLSVTPCIMVSSYLYPSTLGQDFARGLQPLCSTHSHQKITSSEHEVRCR